MRDLWDNNLFKLDPKLPFNTSLINAFKKFYIKKWSKKAAFVSCVSEPMKNFLTKELSVKNINLIYNGYENSLFLTKYNNLQSDKFTFSIIGTIYPNQDIDILLKGFNQFLTNKNLDTIQINLIGIKMVPEVYKKISDHLPPNIINATNRIPRGKAIEYMLYSDVLFYSGWKGYSGVMSTKIFEYLGAKKNILIAPGDDDVIDNLINTTKSGKLANSANEFSTALTDWYNEWIKNGYIKYNGDNASIIQYTRENQAKKMAEVILESEF